MIAAVRAQLAAVLAGELADADVIPYGVELDAIEADTVLVVIDAVRPPDVACPTDTVEATIVAVVPTRAPGLADDDLDALHDRVTDALDPLPGLRRVRSTRGRYQESWPAYLLQIEVRA